ncbi:EIF(ISO)4G2, partial [Symbiodinium sp. CCMP2592]
VYFHYHDATFALRDIVEPPLWLAQQSLQDVWYGLFYCHPLRAWDPLEVLYKQTFLYDYRRWTDLEVPAEERLLRLKQYLTAWHVPDSQYVLRLDRSMEVSASQLALRQEAGQEFWANCATERQTWQDRAKAASRKRAPPGSRVALFSQIRDCANIIESFVRHYAALGFCKLLLYLDDPSDSAAEVLQKSGWVQAGFVELVAVDAQLREQWPSMPSWERVGRFADMEVQSRQILNNEHALRRAGELRLDWLLHVDSDELLGAYSRGCIPAEPSFHRFCPFLCAKVMLPEEAATTARKSVRRSKIAFPELTSPASVQQVLARHAKLAARWRSDTSTFSALNLEVADVKPSLQSPLFTLLLKSSFKPSEKAQVPDAKPTVEPEQDERAQQKAWLATRQKLLSFRKLVEDSVPPEMVGLGTKLMIVPSMDPLKRQQSEPCPSTFTEKSMPKRQTSTREPRSRGGSRSGMSPAMALPTPSANAYRVGTTPQSDIESLKRKVQSLLNKVCPENLATIVGQIAAVQVEGQEQLEAIIELIFRKAVTEPHYCETYADLVFSLKSVYPDFPSPDGGKPVTFRSLVLNICQNEFEELLASSDLTEEEKSNCDAEEKAHLIKQKKHRMCANMKFIGHLFLRQLLSTKVVGSVICELVCFEDDKTTPEEHALECACELLLTAGYTMESLPAGEVALRLACDRLKDLKVRKTPEGKNAYSKRMQFMIQDVLETRAAGWSKKVFKASAKTKEELRESSEKASGKEAVAEHVVTGKRPVYLGSR